MKILHLEKNCYSSESLRKLSEVGVVHYHDFESAAEFKSHLSNNSYEVIFTKLGVLIGMEEIKLQPELRHIVTPTTGLNHIDLNAAAEKNIQITSLKGKDEFLAQVQSTAEHTWMLLLAIIRNLIPSQNDVKEGNWNRVPHLADELNTKTIGIIGLGRLGKILLRYARAFSMQVMCNDLNEKVFTDEYAPFKTSIDELLKKSDYVILQIDYRPDNQRFFDTVKFQNMKDRSYFINTSRGEVVDQKALLEALKSGKLKGAALDVLDGDSSWEKHTNHSPLLEYSKQNTNLLITPHMGGYGRISIEMTRDFIVNEFLKIQLL